MITTEEQLDVLLSAPSDALVRDLASLDGDVMVLGAGGKMGPTLCRMARRALDAAGREGIRVYAVSRWSNGSDRELASVGVETVKADLAAPCGLEDLPAAPNVIYMIGAKFGTSAAPHEAWMANTVLAAEIARRLCDSTFITFSTGNLYPLVPVMGGGASELDPVGPVGDYGMSCLGRERVFEAISDWNKTRVVLFRLNYAVELRYGVLCDLALKVRSGEPIDVETGYVNVVWQRYANEVALRCLLHASAPPMVLNVTGPETLSVRRMAHELGVLLGREPHLLGTEAPTALLSDASRCHALFGYPDVQVPTLLEWTVEWLERGGRTWNKPTKFERRDGKF
jgi:hypothetical protein